MERLTRVFEQNNQKYVCIDVCGEKCVEGHSVCHDCKPFTDVLKKLVTYEDAEDQGLLAKVVHGEWIECYGNLSKHYHCSECKRGSEYKTNFCQNCGADMRKAGAE